MISRLLFWVSLVSCLLVLASFVLFVYDQASGADKHQLAELTGQSNGTTSSRGLDRHQPRRFIDGAAHVLTSPFRLLVAGDSIWAVWISSTVLALLVYGLGLGFLSRVARL